MNRALLDFWVGTLVVIGLLALVFLSLRVANLSGVNGNDVYHVNASFENIGDLKVRAPVKSAGVVVGRVTDIRYDTEQHRAVVTVGIDQRYRFSADSSMSILTSGLLGEQYIGIEIGADEELLNEGDSVWLTSSAVVLENLIGKFLMNTSSQSNRESSNGEQNAVNGSN